MAEWGDQHSSPNTPEDETNEFASTTPQTSVIVTIPEDTEAYRHIQDIRRVHDKQYFRWMPHINILYPFIPQNRIESALTKLRSAASTVEPFEIELVEIKEFDHGRKGSGTIFVDPEERINGNLGPSKSLQSLYSALAKEFPRATESRRGGSQEFVPHMTVSQENHLENTTKIKDTWRVRIPGSHPNYKFQVSEIYVIARTENTPFEFKYKIPLGKTPPDQTTWTQKLPSESLKFALDPEKVKENRKVKKSWNDLNEEVFIAHVCAYLKELREVKKQGWYKTKPGLVNSLRAFNKIFTNGIAMQTLKILVEKKIVKLEFLGSPYSGILLELQRANYEQFKNGGKQNWSFGLEFWAQAISFSNWLDESLEGKRVVRNLLSLQKIMNEEGKFGFSCTPQDAYTVLQKSGIVSEGDKDTLSYNAARIEENSKKLSRPLHRPDQSKHVRKSRKGEVIVTNESKDEVEAREWIWNLHNQ